MDVVDRFDSSATVRFRRAALLFHDDEENMRSRHSRVRPFRVWVKYERNAREHFSFFVVDVAKAVTGC